MKLFNLAFFLTLAISLTSCGTSDEDRINELLIRLEQAETKLNIQNEATLSLTQNGSCMIITQSDDGALLECLDGSSFFIQNGKDGVDGKDGDSCEVLELEDKSGAVIKCGGDQEFSSVLIRHGEDGQDGQDGENGKNGEDGQDGISQVIEFIDPCGDNGRFDEILLRFSDGTIIAHYAGGNNKQFLTTLTPGLYSTTDGHACIFRVEEDGSVTNP